MKLHIAIGITLCLILSALPVRADLSRTGDMRWAVVASTRDLDEAIGIARIFRYEFTDTRVVEASNGWLAVAIGPVSIRGGVTAARDRLRARFDMPNDLFLSNGEAFLRTLWRAPHKTQFHTYEIDAQEIFSRVIADVSVSISPRTVNEGDLISPGLTLHHSGELVFDYVMKDVVLSPESMNAKLSIASLDPTVRVPQIVFSSFWMGAHCCTVTTIFTNVGNEWVAVEADTLDAGGYLLEDINHDGRVELLSIDNSFLYAFAPYAFSWAPRVITRLEGTRLVDMRRDPSFRRFYRQDLARFEFAARREPELWRQNGFLAAWVALKALLGEKDSAWATMLANYDRNSNWPLTTCLTERVDFLCPDGYERRLSFPDALRRHLEEYGYIGTDLNTYARESPVIRWVAPIDESQIADDARHGSGAVPERGYATSAGTGFFVGLDGELITNHHVIDSCRDIVVRQLGAEPVIAKLLASDETNDLALLQIEGAVENAATIRPDIRLGEQVAAFGYPLAPLLSSSGNFTLGNVTALSGMGDDSRFLQISAPVQPGNSGGPLLDEHGNVAGVVTGKINALLTLAMTGDLPQNINFAVRGSRLYGFLHANGITPLAADTSVNLSAPDIAERASGFSVAVRCHNE
ncbi:MAG: S1C family serine protease [Salinarimonas sp.]